MGNSKKIKIWLKIVMLLVGIVILLGESYFLVPIYEKPWLIIAFYIWFIPFVVNGFLWGLIKVIKVGEDGHEIPSKETILVCILCPIINILFIVVSIICLIKVIYES
ncbi:MAG: hypothetical protein LBU27_01850 [Candidatus Peribacteria bacterium]|jgi:hypothetical protein|nr:hypothetical protein [Candidatus Peribacteria bacterium]